MAAFLARENLALILSSIGAALFAILGITWGLWVDSLVILFDGAYSLVSLMLSLLSVYAARLMRKPACDAFPLGRGALEPLVIAIKGLTITLVCVISLFSAIAALLSGGQVVDAGMALIFSGISVIGCALVWAYMHWATGHNQSGLLLAEKKQWLMDMALSAAVLIGFSAAALLETGAWAHLARYADPLMMVLISGYFLVVPVKMTAAAVRELLLSAPSEELQSCVSEAMRDVGLHPDCASTIKVGPSLMVEVALPDNWSDDINRLRFRLHRKLANLPVEARIFVHAAD